MSTSVVPQRLGPVKARLARKGAISALGQQWRCGCGCEHSFGVYAAAHWQDALTHECECGVRRTFRAGKVIAVAGRSDPKLAISRGGPTL